MIHDIPAAGASRWPNRAAVVTPDVVVSYRELAERVERMAVELGSAGNPGDRVAVVGDNSIDYVVALYAVPLAGRILAMVNQRLHVDEQRGILDRVDAGTVLGDAVRLDALRSVDATPGRVWRPFVTTAPGRPDRSPGGDTPDEAVDRRPAGEGQADPAWLIHTSGTTGPAKGVPLTHANLRAAVDAGARGRPVRDGDVYLFPFPLCHVAAYNVLLQHDHGATVVLPSGFDAAEVLATIERLAVTTMSMAPTMIVRLLDHGDRATTDLTSLRSVGYGAAALPPAARSRAETLLGCDVLEGYGMTELAGNAAFDGVPDRDLDVRLVDEDGLDVPAGEPGEIVARGPQVVAGYWDDPAATAEAFVGGWFRTGDIGRFDASGRLSIVDRRKDIIITGGENVASREVEDIVAAHPDVAEVAVVGLPDVEWGERVVAIVVASADGNDNDRLAERVVAHCREHLAGFKTPRQVEILDALPVNSTGKVDKRALRARLDG